MPHYVEINPKKGRIGPDDSRALELSFYCKEEIEISKKFIEMKVRGGKPLKIPFHVKAIIP